MKMQSLRRMRETPGFEAVDFYFGEFLMRTLRPGAVEVAAAGMLLMRSLRNGDSCIDLKQFAGTAVPGSEPEERFPGMGAWRAVLPAADTVAPVVLDDAGRLYLHRFYRAECEVARRIAGHAARSVPVFDLAPGALADLHDYFKTASGASEIDWQQAAVYASGAAGFSVITGGPGTGKTTIVAALLALELQRNPELSIALAAPTGKAQSRMREALREAAAQLHISSETRALLELLPSGTIHSFLAPRADGTFRFNAETPLPYDLIVVDECSMISLALMDHFLRAVRPDARLVFLGDRNQLAAVEAGAVFGDLCSGVEVNVYRETVRAGFQRVTGWVLPGGASSGPVVTELVRTHRFAAAPTLGEVSSRIRQCSVEGPELAEFIFACDQVDFRARQISSRELENVLRAEAEKTRATGTRLLDLPALAQAGKSSEAFALFDSFRILCAVREGEFGVLNANRIMCELLGLRTPYAPGTPLMILRNDRRTGLHNGDIGIVCGKNGETRVCFPESERPFLIAELPEHETVFAMTVHKSQGSGFESVLLLLPERDTPVLTRELIYTGITRAKRQVEIRGTPEILAAALARKTVRSSGLAERLKLEYELQARQQGV